jgi:hypothetical protein
MTSIEGIDELLHHEQTGDLDDFLLYRTGVGAETMRA